MNQNTSKKVFKLTEPIEREEELLASIPESAVVTAYEKTTKTVKVAYVLENTIEPLEDLSETFNQSVKPVKLDRIPIKDKQANAKKKSDKVLALLNIADFHLNRKVVGKEINGNDYDLDIATEVFMRLIDESCFKLQNNGLYNIDKIILNTSGDFLNEDGKQGATTKGTPQIWDTTWKASFNRATELLEYALLELSKIAPVEYYYVAGNHDEQVGFYLTSWLAARFKNVEHVHVGTSPAIREVISYHQNILILDHGDSVGSRAIDLPFVDPKARDQISGSYNIEVLTGHLHQRKVDSKNGVKWEILASACPVICEWTYGKGFDPAGSEATINYYNETRRVQQDYIDTQQILKSIQEDLA